jgi:acyl-coenzyme A synthetase/AMP-(fatty) acid ligase
MAVPATTIHDRYTDDEVEAYYASGFWKPVSFYGMALEHAQVRGDRRFVFDSTTSLTYADFREQALRVAVGLKRQGISAGDRVAVQLPNWTEFPVIAAALSRIGAIIVPIMPIYRGDEVGYVLQHSGAVAAITCQDFRGFDHLAMFAELAPGCPDLRQLIAARASDDLDPTVAISLTDLVVDGEVDALEVEAGADSSPDDGFLIVYTSGTTSRPKGCYHSVNTVRSSAAAILKSLDYTEDDIQFGPSPITHSTGLVTSVMLPMLVGASSHLMEAWDPEEGLKRVEEHKLTAAVTATPFLQMLMGVYDKDKHDASSLRLWVCAGSPIPGAVVEQSRALLGFQTLSLYGRSENFLTTMCTVLDAPARSATSDGSAVDGALVKIVDSAGVEVARGEEGDIAYKGPSHMIEYFRNDEETTALFTPDGFSRSGDLGRMDADGYVRVTGRLKDIVIRGGMNISAREVEEHLLAHPSIANAAIVGMPDERLGEKLCAYVVLAPSATSLELAEVAAFLREHNVATQKLPERLELTSELPTTATGKIQKHLLRADVARKLS